MSGGIRISEEKIGQITEEYDRLKNYRAAASRCGVVPNTVKKYVLKRLSKPEGLSEGEPETAVGQTYVAEAAGGQTYVAEAAGGQTYVAEAAVGHTQQDEPAGALTHETARNACPETEKNLGGENAEAAQADLKRVMGLLLRRMGDPEAVTELSAYQAAKVYTMLCEKTSAGGKAEGIRISFGSVTGEDMSIFGR